MGLLNDDIYFFTKHCKMVLKKKKNLIISFTFRSWGSSVRKPLLLQLELPRYIVHLGNTKQIVIFSEFPVFREKSSCSD